MDAAVFEIYCHTSPSGKQYVGKAPCAEARWRQHVWEATRGRRGCRAFHAAIRKHGPDAFSHDVLETVSGWDEANAAEKKWIAAKNSRAPHGYNLLEGGGSGPMHEDSRRKMSATKKAAFEALSPAARAAESERLGDQARKVTASLTPEQLSDRMRKANASFSAEERSEIRRAMWAAKAPEERSERAIKANASMTAVARSERSVRRNAAMTPERRSEIARKINASMTADEKSAASKKSFANRSDEDRKKQSAIMHAVNAGRTPESRIESARKGAETRRRNRAAGAAGNIPQPPLSLPTKE